MAKPANYDVPPPPMPGAHEEWEELLETLHHSGTLRVLNGLFGQLGKVSDVAFDNLNSEKGRNLIGLLLGAGEVASHLDAKETKRVASGAVEGIAQSRYPAKPPGIWRLFRLMFAPDTRRAIGRLLLILNRIGAAMRQPVPREPSP